MELNSAIVLVLDNRPASRIPPRSLYAVSAGRGGVLGIWSWIGGS